MDPHWLPWCWAAGAAASVAVCWAVNPWREEFCQGWALVRKFPAAWGIPGILLLLDSGFSRLMGHSAAGRLAEPSPLAACGAVREGLHGWTFGYATALLAAGLILCNVSGLRRGLFKGTQSVTGRPGRPVYWLLAAGLAGLLADLFLQGRGLPMAWHVMVSALGIPLLGWTAAAVLGGLLLLAETLIRAPDKLAEVRWLESAAAHSVRLWPWMLVHGVGAWMSRWLPPQTAWYTAPVLAVLATTLAFMPMIFLHVKRASEARDGCRHGLEPWTREAWQPLMWLACNGMFFFGWHLTGTRILDALTPAPEALRVAVAGLWTLLQTGLTVLALGAWVALRLAVAPPSSRPGRARKAKPK